MKSCAVMKNREIASESPHLNDIWNHCAAVRGFFHQLICECVERISCAPSVQHHQGWVGQQNIVSKVFIRENAGGLSLD